MRWGKRITATYEALESFTLAHGRPPSRLELVEAMAGDDWSDTREIGKVLARLTEAGLVEMHGPHAVLVRTRDGGRVAYMVEVTAPPSKA